MHYTVHHGGHTKERKRIPLRTSRIQTARSRRDAILRSLPQVRPIPKSFAA
jgi:hypothetical protein